MSKQVEDFRVESAKCADERDRAHVTAQIDKLFFDVSSFERYVHSEMSAIIGEQFGGSQRLLPLGMLTRISFPFVAVMVIDLSHQLQSATASYRWHYMIGTCICCGPYWHLVVNMMMFCATIRLDTKTRKEELAVVIGNAVLLSLIAATWYQSFSLAVSEQYIGKLVILVVTSVGVLLQKRASLFRCSTARRSEVKQHRAEYA
jgi:hypothetical protein